MPISFGQEEVLLLSHYLRHLHFVVVVAQVFQVQFLGWEEVLLLLDWVRHLHFLVAQVFQVQQF